MTKIIKNQVDKKKFKNQMLSPKEAAKYLSLHLVTIYRLIKKEELPCFRVGGQWRFKKDLLDKWILKNTLITQRGNSGHGFI